MQPNSNENNNIDIVNAPQTANRILPPPNTTPPSVIVTQSQPSQTPTNNNDDDEQEDIMCYYNEPSTAIPFVSSIVNYSPEMNSATVNRSLLSNFNASTNKRTDVTGNDLLTMRKKSKKTFNPANSILYFLRAPSIKHNIDSLRPFVHRHTIINKWH